MKNPKIVLQQNFTGWFGHKESEPIGVHDNFVIIQRKLMFKKRIGSTLTWRWSDTT